MTQLYVFVDDYLKEHPAQAAWRRSNNDAPAFTDAEVITIGLLQGAFGCATLKKACQLATANWRSAFPRLCSYGQWMARLHTLSALVGQLLQAAVGLCGLSGRLYMIDGLPIRVCKSIRPRAFVMDGCGSCAKTEPTLARARQAGSSGSSCTR